jgi:hypothetical protein
MSFFVLTINNLSPALEKQVQEVERIQRFGEKALQAVRAAGGNLTSGNIMDAGGVTVIGSWTYTPQGLELIVIEGSPPWSPISPREKTSITERPHRSRRRRWGRTSPRPLGTRSKIRIPEIARHVREVADTK